MSVDQYKVVNNLTVVKLSTLMMAMLLYALTLLVHPAFMHLAVKNVLIHKM